MGIVDNCPWNSLKTDPVTFGLMVTATATDGVH